MIIFKFIRKEYTWIISENWVPLFTFLLTLLGGVIIKLRCHNQILAKKREDRKNRMLPPRGGANIMECLKPDKAYELVDDAVKLAVRQNFNEVTRGRGPLIINVELLFIVTLCLIEK